MSSPNSPQSRRTFLKRGSATVAGSAVAGGLPALVLGAESALAADAAAANPIVAENLRNPSSHTSDYRVADISTVVDGYARRTSVNLGEPIDLAISGPNRWLGATEAEWGETVEIELYRLGYYDGKGASLVWKTPKPASTWQRFDANGEPKNEFEGGQEPPIHPEDPHTGLFGRANNRTTVTIPGDACPTSGVYLAKLKGKFFDYPGGAPPVARSGESHIVFIVRDDSRKRDLLALLPTNTWQAYNYWGGRSTYTYNSRYQNAGSIVPATGTERAAKVSFDRPFNNWIGDYNWVLRTEFPAIYWMEKQGFDVAYTDDVALTFDPGQALPDKSKGVVILGHGEYWTKQQRDALDAARDAGTNIYNFGANTAYWRVRYEDADGKPATKAEDARVLVCYKTIEGGGTLQPTIASEADPVEPTTTWRDPGKGPGITPGTTAATPTRYTGNSRPESELLGVQYIGDDDSRSRGLTVPADNGKGEFSGHRAWRRTSVAAKKSSTTLGTDLVGWEWDGIPSGAAQWGKLPTTKPGTTLQRLSESDPRADQPSGAETVYLQDAGRTYGGRNSAAQPPTGGTPFSHATTYRAPSGALVFSSGTIHWSWGLGPHHLHSNTDSYALPARDDSLPEIQQATTNLLVDGGIKPATPRGVVIDETPDGGGPGPGPGPGTDKDAPVLTLSLLTRTVLGITIVGRKDRALTFKVSCSKTEKSGPVKITQTLSYAGKTWDTETASVQPGKTVQLSLTIPSGNYNDLPKIIGSRSVKLTTVGVDAAGNKRTLTHTLKIRGNLI